MDNRNLAAAAIANFGDISARGKEAIAIASIFLAGAFVFALVFGSRRGTDTGLRGILGWMFPAELYRHSATRADMFSFAISYVLWMPLMRTILSALATLISMGAVFQGLLAAFGPRASWFDSQSALIAFQVLVLFLSGEFTSYWTHRFLHTVPLLWSIHRVHHSAEALTLFTRMRFHPIDLIISGFGKVVPAGVLSATILYLAGTPPDRAAMMAYLAAGSLIPYGLDVWRHTHVPITFGPLNRVINAPAMHQIHHSAEPRHFDKNMGAETMLFDWLFGTLYLPARGERYRWGLNPASLGPDNPHLRMGPFYLEPFRYARSRLRAGAPAKPALESMHEA